MTAFSVGLDEDVGDKNDNKKMCTTTVNGMCLVQPGDSRGTFIASFLGLVREGFTFWGKWEPRICANLL